MVVWRVQNEERAQEQMSMLERFLNVLEKILASVQHIGSTLQLNFYFNIATETVICFRMVSISIHCVYRFVEL